MVELLDFSYPTLAENLALEEVLLEPLVGSTEVTPVIRIWEQEQASIVLGRGEDVFQQVNIEQAKQQNIPILRRVSGGGTVLHRKGNINLSFFFPYTFCDGLDKLHHSYQIILSWVQNSLKESHGIVTQVQGSSDITVNGKKISGTAQARKRYGLLHHLTLLIDFDFSDMKLLLREPKKRPEYRGDKKHLDFLTCLSRENVQFNRESFLLALISKFGGSQKREVSASESEEVRRLVKRKYCNNGWNMKGRIE